MTSKRGDHHRHKPYVWGGPLLVAGTTYIGNAFQINSQLLEACQPYLWTLSCQESLWSLVRDVWSRPNQSSWFLGLTVGLLCYSLANYLADRLPRLAAATPSAFVRIFFIYCVGLALVLAAAHLEAISVMDNDASLHHFWRNSILPAALFTQTAIDYYAWVLVRAIPFTRDEDRSSQKHAFLTSLVISLVTIVVSVYVAVTGSAANVIGLMDTLIAAVAAYFIWRF